MVAIVILSLIPQVDRVGTGLSGKYEHFLAYSVTAFLFALSSGRRGGRMAVAGLATLAFLLEALQHWATGRHPKLSDALVGVIAASLGAVLAGWLSKSSALRL